MEAVPKSSARSINIMTARSKSYRSQKPTGSQMVSEHTYTDRDPYMANNKLERPSLIDIIQGDSSRVSSKSKNSTKILQAELSSYDYSKPVSARLEDIQIEIEEVNEKQEQI